MADTQVKRTFWLDAGEVNKFKRRHQGHGDLSWFLREALRRYNELNEVNPEELVQLAVREISFKQ